MQSIAPVKSALSPSKKRIHYGGFLNAIVVMEVGDCVAFPIECAKSCRANASMYGKKLDRIFTCKSHGESILVYRVE